LLARFQLPTEPGTLDEPIGTVGEFSRFSDFPSGGILWFDRRRAVENRLARKITEDNRAEPSLPPTRVRDIVVDEKRLDELYPENAAARPAPNQAPPLEAITQTETADEPRRLPAATPSGIRTSRAERAEEACEQWLGSLTERPKNKDSAFEDAKVAVAAVGLLSRKAFEHAWANTVCAEWRIAGRRKSNPVPDFG
jgi:hypothetical protein